MKADGNFSKIQKLLNRGLKSEVFSAAQAAWSIDFEPPRVLCAGSVDSRPVGPRTLFDIASLTKVFAASTCLRLSARNVLELEHPLRDIMPRSAQIKNAALLHLLSHEAGFPSWLPLFERIPVSERGTETARDKIIEEALFAPAVEAPGRRAIYSDLGFIALARALEDATGQRTDQIVKEEVLLPLGLKDTFYRPLHETKTPSDTEVAPTETCPWRQKKLQGEVHDDNAWTMGGVSGHAGLFSTASDTVAFGMRWLSTMADGQWLPSDTARHAIEKRLCGRALGWDIKSPRGSSAGELMGEKSFGHLGFTGCSLWTDPDRCISIALLTNRVCFGRDNNRIRAFRPVFHDTLIELLK